jgi:uncharacterized protein YjiK
MKLPPFLLPFLLSAVLPGILAAQTTTTFVPLNSVWKYLDNGTNQGTAWRAAGFNDSGWAQGPAELGYGDGGEATVVSYGPSSSSKYITTYFRKSFPVTNAAAFTTAALRVRRDDGVVIYLNGTEVYRNNLPTGTISYTSLAPSAIGGADESALPGGTVNPALLVEGTNVLAVEMHQNAANSSDLSFDMDFTGTMPGNTPTANAQSVTVTENTAKQITLTGSDPNGDPITFAIATQPAKGVVSGAAPNLTYTPNLNATGADSFTFTVSDGTNTSAAATVSLTILDLNDPPVADAQTVTLAEEGSTDIVLNGSDAESVYGMLPSYTEQLYNGNLAAITDGLSGATWNANTGTLFLIRNVSSGGGHSYEYTADGTHLRTITQTGFLDTEAIAWMYGNTYAIAEENNNQRISIVTIAPGATTLDRTAAGNVTWTTPVGSLLNLGIESLCYDAGRDVLYYLCEKPAGGAWPVYIMNPQTGVTTVLCDLNGSVFASGVATDFSDMAFDRATDTFVILSHESNKIVRVDRAGTVVEQRGFTTGLTQAEMIALTPDRLRLFIGGEPKQFARYALPADTLTYNLVTPPAHGSLSGIPPRLTYTPVPNFSGTDSFTFRMWDGTVYSAEATVTLNVTPANDPPAGTGISTTAEETEPTLIVLPVSDPDGDELTIQSTPPLHGTLSLDGTMATYTASTGYTGPDSFTYTASDGEFTVGPFTVNIAVVPSNAAPVSSDGNAALDEDTPAPVTLVATDAENDPLSWNIVTPPANGTLSGTAPNLTYTPALNFHGSDSFTWSASDATKTSAPATFSITVSPVNDAPAAQSFAVFTETNTPATVTLAGSDVENAPLSFTVISLPASGTLSGTPPALTYTPDAGFTGADSFAYTANDGALDAVPATVSITVTGPVLDNLVSSGAVWKYLANGSNQGSAWRGTSFDDTAWPQGPAQLGYGDGDEVTVVPYGPDSNNRYITTYFRHEFQVPNPGALTGPLQLELLRDDGAVVYLNGTEVFRSNMPAGSIAWNTLAPTAVANADEDAFFSTTLQSGLILPGRNVLAVEIHQNAGSSSDISFDLKLYETVPSITRGPYVQMTGTDRATVRWRTNVAVSSVLNFGTEEGALASTVTGTSPVMEHEVHVTGLTPDTLYYYSAGSPQGAFVSGPDYSFSTHPPPDTTRPYRFWVLGDAGTGTVNQTSVRDAFYAWNGSSRVDGVLLLGDNVYETGTDAEYQTKLFEVYPSMLRNTTFWPAFGNHDAGSASSSTQTGPYYDSFSMPKFAEAGGLASGTEAYYSFDYGNIHFVCLDSEGSSLSGSGAMAQWLQADLAATQREWIIAYWHHPTYSKGSHDSDSATADSGRMKNMREIFLPILEGFGVDLLLFGHEHAYFRSKFVDGHYGISTTFNATTMLKQAGMGNPAVDGPYVKVDGPNNGAVYTVAGSSGKLDSYSRSMPVLALALNELGSVVLDVNGRELTSRFLNNSGVVRDTFSIVHNAPPVAAAAALDGIEDTPMNVTLTAADADNDPLTWEIVTPPAVGSLFGTAPNLTFTPPSNFNGSTSLDFRVSDGRANSATVTVTLNIAPVNDAPLATAATATSGEDTSVSLTLSGADADGDALSFTVTTAPAHGVLSGTAPDLTYTPDTNWYGEDAIAFTVSDGLETSGPAQVTITVIPVNDVPVAAPQTLTGDEDNVVSILLSGTDIDGDVLDFSIITPPAHGVLSGTLPNLTYLPAADWNGTDSFEFAVSDGAATSASAVVTLNIGPLNDVPLALAQSPTTEEDTAMALTLTGIDPDGDALTYTVLTQPVHGILSGTAPGLTYTPEADWHGADSVDFMVQDASGASLPATVTLIVTPVNDPPVPAAQSLATDEDTALPLVIAATDIDGDALTFAITSPPAHGTLSGTAPDLIYTPNADWNGSDSFIFTASDGTEVVSATISIEVPPMNDAPVAGSAAVSTMEDTAVPVVLSATDAEGDAVTFVITALPAHGSLSGTLPNLIYTPSANYHGSDEFTFTASDASGAGTPASVSITITPVNDVPVATALVFETAEDTAGGVALSGTDIEGDLLGFVITSLPAHGSLSGTVPDLIYTPDADWNGTDSFVYAVTDGPAVSEPATVSITVTPVNDRPVATPQSLITSENTTVPVILTAEDVDGDTISFSITLQPAHGTLSGTAPNLVYTPEPGWEGVDSFSFTASDAVETSLAAAITVETNPVNDPPVALAQSLSAMEDTALPVALTGTDGDGDPLSFTVTALPVSGTLSGTAPSLIYTPAPDFAGTDSIEFTVSDGALTSAPAVITIAVEPVNDSPLAQAQSIVMDEDASLPVTLLASDVENDVLTFTASGLPQHGTLSGTAPNLIYTPESNFHGADSFEFTVSDGTAPPVSAVVSIAITPANDAPVATPQELSTEEDAALPIVLAGGDADGDALTFSVTVPPIQGSLSGTAPNLTYTPNADWHGSDSFGFTVSDGIVTSPVVTVSLTVSSVNDAPVAADQSLATDALTAVSVSLGATDIEGDSLTFSIVTSPAHGTLSGEAPALTYTPHPAWDGVDTFTFTASDGSAVSAPATVTITIAPASPWQLVVSTGQVVPGANGAAVGSVGSDYVSDATGRASFRAAAGSVTGIWTEGDSGLEAVIVQGSSAAGVNGALWDSVTVGPWAAGDGELLLYGRMTPGAGGVTNSTDYAFWHRSGGSPVIVAREGTAPPSMPAAARFSTLSTVATLEAGGNYAFAATMSTNSSLGITTANDTGLWGTFGSAPRLIVRESGSAPGAGTGVFDTLTSATLRSNSEGQLTFSTALKVGGSISTANRFGLWLWDPLQFGLVARGGDQAPGTPAGANFAQPQQPSLGGALAFLGTLTTGSGGVTNSSDTGIWVLDGGAVSLAAREGMQAPGIAAGGLFNGIADAAVVNDDGDYTFRAALRNGGGVSSSNNAGIWTRSAATGGILTIVARKGAVAPGAGAGTWSSFEVPLIANDGGEAFTATLTQSSAAGVTASNDRGLWVRSSDGSLVLALREGDAFTAGPEDTRTVSAITLPGAQASGRTPFSDDGRLLVLIGFTDGSTALCRYTLP